MFPFPPTRFAPSGQSFDFRHRRRPAPGLRKGVPKRLIKHLLKGLTVNALLLVSLGGGAIAVRAENPDHVRQLLETNECVGCDLSGSRLQGLDLTGANLAASQLNDANLTNTTLTRANLQGANLREATLTGATLQGANLTDASLRDVSIVDSCDGFFGAMMLGASAEQSTCMAMQLLRVMGPEEFCSLENGIDEDILQWSDLCNPDDFLAFNSSFFGQLFVTPNFQGANFSNADLTGVNLSAIDLRYATLAGANLTNTTLDLAILLDAVVENTQGGDFSQAIFSNQEIAEAIAPMFLQQAIAAYESEARTSVGSLNRAQQAYFVEREQFSPTIADLQLGMTEETEQYHYSITQTRADLTVQAAVPKRDDLMTYLGMVYLQADEATGEAVTVAVLCVSNLPATPIPTIPAQASLPSDADDLGGRSCPEGFWDYQTGVAGESW